MLKLVGVSLLLLSACASFEIEGATDTELSWSLDPECEKPDEVQRGWIEEGFLLWTEHFEVNIIEVAEPIDDGTLFFEVCPMLEHPRPGYGGWAEMHDGRGRISFYTGPS